MTYILLKKSLQRRSNKPKSDTYIEDPPMLVGFEVYPEDDEPMPTGILTEDGEMIYRMEDKVQIGFCSEKLNRHEEN